LTILFYVVPETRIWMRALFPALLLSLLLLSLARGVFLRLAHVAALQRNILVLGTGEHAKTLEDLERRRRPSAFRIAGFVPLGVEPTLIAPDRIVRANNLLQQCEALGIGEIVVAATERRLALPTEDLLECRLCGIHVSNLSAFLERELGQVDVDGLNPSSLIFSNVAPGGPVERGMKRLFDVVLSIALLVISGPALLFTALAIKLYDGGPVFYRQERVGLYGRRISLLKFRSMRVDAEGDGKPRWAEKKDPRTTPVGRFIRQTRIDEIPQVFNVLAGEMSFVGPRPERPAIIDDLAREIPFYGYRHFVKPGITGWAQINYPYGASLADAKQKLKFDLFYVKNFGLLLDLVILIQTVRVVLWPQGVR
jgi:sugar transferase (PEP-CTERM system associated)